MIKFYDLVPSRASRCFFSPNTWKTRLSLLHKNVPFETIPVTLADIRQDLIRRSGQANLTAPAIELPDGRILFDSFRISEWLEENYPDAQSLFTGDGQSTSNADRGHLQMGKNYARLVDLGLGASKPQWNVWFELCFPQLDRLMIERETSDYFRSDLRLGPNGYQRLICLNQDELTERARLNLQPFIQILKERPEEYFQGKVPGQVDYILFGRYAYCRMLNPQLTKFLWHEQSEELHQWIEKISQAFDGHANRLFQSYFNSLENN
jgi:hypothetical protein